MAHGRHFEPVIDTFLFSPVQLQHSISLSPDDQSWLSCDETDGGRVDLGLHSARTSSPRFDEDDRATPYCAASNARLYF